MAAVIYTNQPNPALYILPTLHLCCSCVNVKSSADLHIINFTVVICLIFCIMAAGYFIVHIGLLDQLLFLLVLHSNLFNFPFKHR